MNSDEVKGALPSARAGALRAEPPVASQAEPLVPNAAINEARRQFGLGALSDEAIAGSLEYILREIPR